MSDKLMSDKLMELARRVEGLSGPDRGVDADILRALGYTWRGMAYWHADDRRTWSAPTHFTASIDAALTLVPEGWSIALYSPSGDLTARAALSCAPRQHIGNNGASICLALCAAALRSRASMGEGE